MRPTNVTDDTNASMDCNEDDLKTDMDIAEEALDHYAATGIAGTRPYSEYRSSRLESAK